MYLLRVECALTVFTALSTLYPNRYLAPCAFDAGSASLLLPWGAIGGSQSAKGLLILSLTPTPTWNNIIFAAENSSLIDPLPRFGHGSALLRTATDTLYLIAGGWSLESTHHVTNDAQVRRIVHIVLQTPCQLLSYFLLCSNCRCLRLWHCFKRQPRLRRQCSGSK